MIAFFNAINTYTDASLYKDEKGITSTCTGYVTVYHGKIIDEGVRILYNTTNNYGEVYAIYMGIQSLLRFAHMDTFLNLFSDSKISVDGLTSWISGWVKNQDRNGVMYSSSGTKVANQEIFSAIINMVAFHGVHLQLHHILGHINPNNAQMLEKARITFKRENGVLLSEEIIREICSYNNYVDNRTRDMLMSSVNNKMSLANYAAPEIAMSYVLSKGMVDNYLKLLSD